MERQAITVFGGSGFLGRRVVSALLDQGFAVRAASRRPERVRQLFRDSDRPPIAVSADINDGESVRTAIEGAFGVVNAVSLYVERPGQSFPSVHVKGAERVARLAKSEGVVRLAHLSGIGSDPRSDSRYIRSRGRGEAEVRGAFPDATMIRPAVMTGPGDSFVTPIGDLLRSSPVFPLFGRGRTRLAPVCVGDVARAIARIIRDDRAGGIYEFGGAQTCSYREALELIADAVGRKVAFVPVPFAAWRLLGSLAEHLTNPPITRNQVELMQVDNVPSPDLPGFSDLEIAQRPFADVLPEIIGRCEVWN